MSQDYIDRKTFFSITCGDTVILHTRIIAIAKGGPTKDIDYPEISPWCLDVDYTAGLYKDNRVLRMAITSVIKKS